MWPWTLTLNVSKTCQQPYVHGDLDINNGAKAGDTVINQGCYIHVSLSYDQFEIMESWSVVDLLDMT